MKIAYKNTCNFVHPHTVQKRDKIKLEDDIKQICILTEEEIVICITFDF